MVAALESPAHCLRSFFRKRIRRSIGLDLGSTSVKSVELTWDGKSATLSGLACAERCPGEELAETLGRVLGQAGLKGREVTMAVGGRGVLVRYVPMPKASDAELRQAMPFEAERLLPLDLEEMRLDYQVLGPRMDGNGQETEEVSVLLAACRRDEVLERIELARGRGLVPGVVDVELFAVVNAWERVASGLIEEAESEDPDESAEGVAVDTERAEPGPENPDATPRGLPEAEPAGSARQSACVALVDMGAERTTISVVTAGTPCFSREIGLGGADLTQVVARALGLGSEEAEVLKRSPGERIGELRAATGGVLEDLGHELAHSLDYVEHNEGRPVEAVWISGGGSRAPGVIDWLGEVLARPVRAWDPLAGLDLADDARGMADLESWRESLAVALGLAWRGLDT